MAVNVDGYGATYVLDYVSNHPRRDHADRDRELSLRGETAWASSATDRYTTCTTRRATSARAQILLVMWSAWLFDPDGRCWKALPVSHLVCGGVYAGPGLIYRGRYFDPNLGYRLALMPLMVVQSWTGGRKKAGASMDGDIACCRCRNLTGCP